MSEPDFTKLAPLYRLCAKHQIGFELHYNEGSQSWCINLVSAAKIENYIGRDYSFDTAIDAVMEFIRLGFRRPGDPPSITRVDENTSVGRFSVPLYNTQNIPRKDTMPITADELRLAGHHLDQAIESLRLAAHCVQTDPNTLLALHLEMLKQQAHELRAILAEQRRTSAS